VKTKLNLTINSKLIPRSKLFAKKKGKSVSQLVEELLEKELEKDKINFTDKWLGELNLIEGEDARFKYLKERYNL